MALKLWNYNTPAEYTYSPGSIEVSGGLAKLFYRPFLLSEVYSCWHLNEVSGIVAVDSANARNGTLINSPTWVTGKLNNCLQFSSAGTIQYVNCGNIADFERTSIFSIECWIKTNVAGVGVFLSRQVSNVGWQMYTNGGQLNFYLGNSYPNYYILVTTSGTPGVSDNAWHHIVFTYDGSSLASGVKIYTDGVLRTVVIGKDTLTLSSHVVANMFIAARADLVYKFNGLIDEVIIYNKVISLSDVQYRYASGAGREDSYGTLRYDNTKPDVKPATLFHADFMALYNHFQETLGGGNVGSIKYNLSHDGVTWYYWNGVDWVVGGDSTNSNTVAEVEAHIGTFTINNDFTFRAFLISDGSQAVELDTTTFDYTANQSPVVEAGAGKFCSDNQSISPFSDAEISDPDGDIENAHAYYYIEGSGWVEILKGVLTLQNAIRAFTYEFDNLGDIVCQLKVTDEIGSSTVDSLIVGVSPYLVTFNIKDESGYHVPNMSVDLGLGLGWQLKSSPFDQSYEYGTFDIAIEKYGYTSLHFSIEPQTTPVVDRLLSLLMGAIWDTLLTSILVDGSIGKLLKDNIDTTISSRASQTVVDDIDSKIDLIEIEANKIQSIKDKTDSLPVDPSSETNASLNVSIIEGKIDILDSNIDLIKIETDKIQPNIIGDKDAYKADVSLLALEATSQSIKDKTDNLPLDPASETNATLNIEEIDLKIDLIDSKVDSIVNIEYGRWRILGTQMIFYKEDNVTEIARFNLYNQDGILDNLSVFERRKV